MLDVVQPDRTKFIGGSDVAAILGISPWRNVVDLWLDKITPPVENGQNATTTRHRMEWCSERMKMTGQQQAEQERYERNVHALVECLSKGVNEESVSQLAFEAGIPWSEIEFFLNKPEAA